MLVSSFSIDWALLITGLLAVFSLGLLHEIFKQGVYFERDLPVTVSYLFGRLVVLGSFSIYAGPYLGRWDMVWLLLAVNIAQLPLRPTVVLRHNLPVWVLYIINSLAVLAGFTLYAGLYLSEWRMVWALFFLYVCAAVPTLGLRGFQWLTRRSRESELWRKQYDDRE